MELNNTTETEADSNITNRNIQVTRKLFSLLTFEYSIIMSIIYYLMSHKTFIYIFLLTEQWFFAFIIFLSLLMIITPLSVKSHLSHQQPGNIIALHCFVFGVSIFIGLILVMFDLIVVYTALGETLCLLILFTIMIFLGTIDITNFDDLLNVKAISFVIVEFIYSIIILYWVKADIKMYTMFIANVIALIYLVYFWYDAAFIIVVKIGPLSYLDYCVTVINLFADIFVITLELLHLSPK